VKIILKDLSKMLIHTKMFVVGHKMCLIWNFKPMIAITLVTILMGIKG